MGNLKNLPLLPPISLFFVVLYQFSAIGSGIGGGAGNEMLQLKINKRKYMMVLPY